jgi:xanthine dehydrogenase accessory factor
MLLVVAESTGSSPGRAGYKMAVAADGEFFGSIGGGVMEVQLVERAKVAISEPDTTASIIEQVHRKNVANASGMICSGLQTVIVKRLTSRDLEVVKLIIEHRESRTPSALVITRQFFIFERTAPYRPEDSPFYFAKDTDGKFHYRESLDSEAVLYIIGGGHCSLALSDLMSRLDFRITIFDDRTDLNTIEKNDFADQISVLADYTTVGDRMPDRDDLYVVVMTLGYASDKVVIKQLCERDFKYLGVLGSKAKMATLMKELRDEGIPAEQLARIRTPIGIQINSRTPEEIAVSIAAEIISVKNATN